MGGRPQLTEEQKRLQHSGTFQSKFEVNFSEQNQNHNGSNFMLGDISSDQTQNSMVSMKSYQEYQHKFFNNPYANKIDSSLDKTSSFQPGYNSQPQKILGYPQQKQNNSLLHQQVPGTEESQRLQRGYTFGLQFEEERKTQDMFKILQAQQELSKSQQQPSTDFQFKIDTQQLSFKKKEYPTEYQLQCTSGPGDGLPDTKIVPNYSQFSPSLRAQNPMRDSGSYTRQNLEEQLSLINRISSNLGQLGDSQLQPRSPQETAPSRASQAARLYGDFLADLNKLNDRIFSLLQDYKNKFSDAKFSKKEALEVKRDLENQTIDLKDQYQVIQFRYQDQFQNPQKYESDAKRLAELAAKKRLIEQFIQKMHPVDGKKKPIQSESPRSLNPERERKSFVSISSIRQTPNEALEQRSFNPFPENKLPTIREEPQTNFPDALNMAKIDSQGSLPDENISSRNSSFEKYVHRNLYPKEMIVQYASQEIPEAAFSREPPKKSAPSSHQRTYTQTRDLDLPAQIPLNSTPSNQSLQQHRPIFDDHLPLGRPTQPQHQTYQERVSLFRKGEYDCPICFQKVSEIVLQDHIGFCLKRKQILSKTPAQDLLAQKLQVSDHRANNSVLDDTFYKPAEQTPNFGQKFNEKVTRILDNLRRILDSIHLPLTRSILEEAIKDLSHTLRNRDARLTQKVIRKLEKSLRVLQQDEASSFNVYLYLKGVQRLLECQDPLQEPSNLMNEISILNEDPSAQYHRSHNHSKNYRPIFEFSRSSVQSSQANSNIQRSPLQLKGVQPPGHESPVYQPSPLPQSFLDSPGQQKSQHTVLQESSEIHSPTLLRSLDSYNLNTLIHPNHLASINSLNRSNPQVIITKPASQAQTHTPPLGYFPIHSSNPYEDHQVIKENDRRLTQQTQNFEQRTMHQAKKLEFYNMANTIKKRNLLTGRPTNGSTISELYEESVRLGIRQEQWEEFINNHFLQKP